MSESEQKTADQIKQLVHEHKEQYANTGISYLVAEMVIRTHTGNSHSLNLRYKRIMSTLFGEPKEFPKGEKDEELLIDAGWHFSFMGFDKEENYKSYVEENPGKTPESYACREAVKSHVYAKNYDFIDGLKFLSKNHTDKNGIPRHVDYTVKHKYDIDLDTKRIISKFTKKRDHYVILAAYRDYLDHPEGDDPSIADEFKLRDKRLRKEKILLKEDLEGDLKLIDIFRNKILNSIDFDFLFSK